MAIYTYYTKEAPKGQAQNMASNCKEKHRAYIFLQDPSFIKRSSRIKGTSKTLVCTNCFVKHNLVTHLPQKKKKIKLKQIVVSIRTIKKLQLLTCQPYLKKKSFSTSTPPPHPTSPKPHILLKELTCILHSFE